MLDLKEERRYTRLRKLAQELHIPMPEVFITLEVFDRDGKLIQRHHQRSHSWTRNAYNLMFCQLACKVPSDATFGAGKLSIKDTAGATQNAVVTHLCVISDIVNPDTPTPDGYLAQATEIDHGIVVGSGTNAESFEDYVLQTPIAEGTDPGKLNAVASELHSVSYADTTLTDTQIRYFNNNSGGNVSVNEVALYTRGVMGTTKYDWAQARDKLTSTVTVPDTGQLKVTYTIELTYPS